MTDTSTPDRAWAPGPVAGSSWSDPAAPAPPAPEGAPVPSPREALDDERVPVSAAEVGGPGEERTGPGEGDTQAEADEATEVGPDEDEEDGTEDDAEDDAEEAQPSRFEVLVEERLRRAHYAHHLTRAVFTPEEAAAAVLVERRAAVWVPTMTFVATVVSAVAAVVLASRLRSDPTDPDGHQLVVVTITVCLLAAAFATLLRAEVHYERLRPTGRVVRHDVADAYEVVRDAPLRLVQYEAPLPVLRRVTGLLPAADQLVDALARYAADGGTRVRQHPAYDRILRMRAEVEALELILEDADEGTLRDPAATTTLPAPHQVADFDGLADLAATFAPAPAPAPAPGPGAGPSSRQGRVAR